MIFAAETRDGRQRWRQLAETFLKVKFHFFSTYFPPSYDPPARLHPVAHRSTFASPTLPPLLRWSSPKIYIFIFICVILIIFSTFFFFINTTNTDRRANSANLEILWNCYVMRYVSVIMIQRWSIAILLLSSTSFLSFLFSSNSRLGCWVLLEPNKNEVKKRKKWQQRRFYGCMCRHQRSLQTLLSHFLLSKKAQ